VELLVVRFSVSSYLLPLRPKHLTQHPLLKIDLLIGLIDRLDLKRRQYSHFHNIVYFVHFID
jgi:hypothetical protein